MKCIRCGQDIEADAPEGVVICGSCADDLRQEDDAEMFGDEAFWLNKEAYEEEQREGESDYRFI